MLGAVALAAAISFGWGARNVAQDIVERAYDRSGARERTGRQKGNGAADTEARTDSAPDSTAGMARRPGAWTVSPNYLPGRSSWGSLPGRGQVGLGATRRGGSPTPEIVPLALVSPGGFVLPTGPALRDHGAQFSNLGLQAGYLVCG